MQYLSLTLSRADRAVRCAPFRLKFYDTIVFNSVSLKTLSGSSGVRYGYTRQTIGEIRAEDELMWLIQVGLLRREVDGQGLTDSFRITPLGRQLLDQWHNVGEQELRPSWRDRIKNALHRWGRWPI
jgi:hypothetical protein